MPPEQYVMLCLHLLTHRIAPKHYCALLKALKRRSLKPAVVVASRLPEVSAWLDALEHGAANYCAAPFESRDIRWILEAALGAWPVVFA